jgi:hypothetical protein
MNFPRQFICLPLCHYEYYELAMRYMSNPVNKINDIPT